MKYMNPFYKSNRKFSRIWRTLKQLRHRIQLLEEEFSILRSRTPKK